MLAHFGRDSGSARRAGLERFVEEGFTLGDPSQYLHAADHPHLLRPQLHGCEGCCPPVHGVVVLLRKHEDVVVALQHPRLSNGECTLRTCSCKRRVFPPHRWLDQALLPNGLLPSHPAQAACTEG